MLSLLLLLLTCTGAMAEPPMRPNGMDLLYDEHIPLLPNGEPIVTVGVVSGETHVAVRSASGLAVSFYEAGIFKQATVPAAVHSFRRRVTPCSSHWNHPHFCFLEQDVHDVCPFLFASLPGCTVFRPPATFLCCFSFDWRVGCQLARELVSSTPSRIISRVLIVSITELRALPFRSSFMSSTLSSHPTIKASHHRLIRARKTSPSNIGSTSWLRQ